MQTDDRLDGVAAETPPERVDPELIRRLPEMVERVSPASRAVLALHYLEELTLPEVAAVLGLRLGTVKSRLAYGLSALRRSARKEARP